MSDFEFFDLFPNIYQLHLPIPKNPLKYLNSYFIKGKNFNLIIDCGLNHNEVEKILFAAIEELNFSPSNTKLLLTHCHSDHSGLSVKLNEYGIIVLVEPTELKVINDPFIWEKESEALKSLGVPEDILEQAKETQVAYKFRPKGEIKFYYPLKDGERLDLGNFVFQAIHTPGHTRGHICLYDEDHKILFSGDHILKDITPNISQFYEHELALDSYLKSLDKIKDLDVKLVLPGHRTHFFDLKTRIKELKDHHQKRLKEVLDIVKNNPGLTPFEVASYMSWDINYSSWEDFPPTQKWFATEEAYAHLKYLVINGTIKEEKDKIKRFYYS